MTYGYREYANMTYAAAMDYRVGLGQVATQLEPDYMLTLAFNSREATSFSYGEDRLRHFHAQLDRYMLGRRWAKYQRELRSHSLGIPQGHNCSGRAYTEFLFDLHYYMYLHAPPFPKMTLGYDRIEKLTHDIWVELVPGGKSTHFQVVREEADDAFEASYYGSRSMAAPGCPGMEHFCIN
jgi:hypothetical protein